MTYALKARNLRKIYKMGKLKVEALRGVNIKVKKGNFVSIMGPSGSGKSTLLHILGVLDEPTSGEVKVGNVKTTNLSDKVKARFRLKKIGFVFQFYSLLSGFTALENVYLPLIQADISEKEAKQKAREALKTVDLSDRMNHKPSELSGGQRQRVAIARAMANDPEIILADEPMSELDTKTSNKIMDIFKDISGDGQTVITVNHEERLGKMANRIIWLEDGKIKDYEG